MHTMLYHYTYDELQHDSQSQITNYTYTYGNVPLSKFDIRTCICTGGFNSHFFIIIGMYVHMSVLIVCSRYIHKYYRLAIVNCMHVWLCIYI